VGLLRRIPVYAVGVGFTFAIVAVADARHWSGLMITLVSLAVAVFYVATILVPYLIRIQFAAQAPVEVVTTSNSNGDWRLSLVNLAAGPKTVEVYTIRVSGQHADELELDEHIPATHGPTTVQHSEPHVAVG
jgi:uncharacterized membrane protein